MKDLSTTEIQQVNGGFAPAVYGAILLGGRIAASPVGGWIASGAIGAVMSHALDRRC